MKCSRIRCNNCRDLQSGRSSSCRDTELFNILWNKEAIPQQFKDATIIHLFNRNGNPQVCDNHRGISLLSISGKILARVLLNCLNEYLEKSGLLPESQCGFRKDRGTIDMIFTARQLQEKCQEQNVGLYMIFVDLTKVFDTVIREGLLKIMAKFRNTAKFIAMVRQFHGGMLARVQNDGELTGPFPVTNGVKQGCVLLQHCSVWCFLPCLQMFSRTVTIVYLLGIALIGSFST